MLKRVFRGVIGAALSGALICSIPVGEANAQGVPPNAAAIYARIQPSLALVAARDGKYIAFGTAFCIGSHGGVAYFLTNQHVVGSDPAPTVVLESDRTTSQRVRVDRVSTLDAVVLAVQDATCQPLTLSKSLPAVGTEIGIAGYPSVQLSLASGDLQKLSPSFHAGSVSALSAGDPQIEYDAQTDHGNSGSPMFDLRTGIVYGLVRLVSTGSTKALQNNFAISVPELASFLDNSHAGVAYSSSQQSLPLAPGSAAASVILNGAAPAAAPIGSNTQPRIVSTAPNPPVADNSCVASGLSATVSKSAAHLEASDYASTISDSRAVIEVASQCAQRFYCPGSSCDEAYYTVMMGLELMAQQNLRTATARTNGDVVNATRNELSSATTLCAVPGILSDQQPYSAIREIMKVSLKLSLTMRAVGPYRSVVDAPDVRACAAKLGVY